MSWKPTEEKKIGFGKRLYLWGAACGFSSVGVCVPDRVGIYFGFMYLLILKLRPQYVFILSRTVLAFATTTVQLPDSVREHE